jgi:hypothetical protein
MKQSCIRCRDLFNDMWHAIVTHVIEGNSRFFVARSQIGTLTLGLSFGHNLYYKYSNGSCKLF